MPLEYNFEILIVKTVISNFWFAISVFYKIPICHFNNFEILICDIADFDNPICNIGDFDSQVFLISTIL